MMLPQKLTTAKTLVPTMVDGTNGSTRVGDTMTMVAGRTGMVDHGVGESVLQFRHRSRS